MRDTNTNFQPKLDILGPNGDQIASFIQFNSLNRSIYGYANQSGSFRVDFVYSDDQGRQTYSNLKITVLPYKGRN
jgi:hypothetical protein